MIFGILPQLYFGCVYFLLQKKNVIMGKGVVVVVLGTGDLRACREQIQNFPKGEGVQSALPTPLPYCLLKNSKY